MSTPTSALDHPNLIVTDISGRAAGPLRPRWCAVEPNEQFPEQVRETRDVALHSVSVNYSGTRMQLSYLGGGYLDRRQQPARAGGRANPQCRLVTPVSHRVRYTNPGRTAAVKVPSRPYALLTEEVYGDLLDQLIGADEHGCPWGWVRLADIRQPRDPRVVGHTGSSRTGRRTAGRRPAAIPATPSAPATRHTTRPCCRTSRS
jgi:hypothetical protein